MIDFNAQAGGSDSGELQYYRVVCSCLHTEQDRDPHQTSSKKLFMLHTALVTSFDDN